MLVRSPNRTRDDFELDFGIELLLDRQQEVAAIALQLKREQIVGEETGQDLACPGTNPQPIWIRPRNVPEQCGARGRTPGAQRRRDERQMVVLDEDRGIRRTDLLVYRLRRTDR